MRECTSHLYDETRLLSRLVEDLRELALADAGQLHLNLRPTDVAQIIRHTVDNFGLAAEAQELDLIAQLPEKLALVQTDADRVAQVLRNLLVNAIHHTPSGGSVTVCVGPRALPDLTQITSTSIISDVGQVNRVGIFHRSDSRNRNGAFLCQYRPIHRYHA